MEQPGQPRLPSNSSTPDPIFPKQEFEDKEGIEIKNEEPPEKSNSALAPTTSAEAPPAESMNFMNVPSIVVLGLHDDDDVPFAASSPAAAAGRYTPLTMGNVLHGGGDADEQSLGQDGQRGQLELPPPQSADNNTPPRPPWPKQWLK